MAISRKAQEETKFKNLIEKALDDLTENPNLPDGVPTLMNIPERRELPPELGIGRPSDLVRLVTETPATYESYLLMLKKGAYFHTAAAAVGIPVKTIQIWARRGKADYGADKDTYYARFYQDVLKAVGQCRVAVEHAIATMQPWKWLGQGPGKIFGLEWADNPTGERDSNETTADFEPELEVAQIEHTSGVETTVIMLDAQTEEETKAVLREVLKDRS